MMDAAERAVVEGGESVGSGEEQKGDCLNDLQQLLKSTTLIKRETFLIRFSCNKLFEIGIKVGLDL